VKGLDRRAVSGVLLTLLLVGVLAAASNILVVEAGGTVYIRANDRELTDQASHVLIGQVNKVQSRWNENETLIYSNVEISVERYLKGDRQGREVTVRVLGGEVGDIGLWVSSEPSFVEGEKVQVFLRRDEGDGFRVVGGNQGKTSLSSVTLTSGSFGYSGIHWADSNIPVEYYISTTVPSTWITVIQQCFQTWEDVDGSYMNYTCMGTTAIGAPENRDDVNVVSHGYVDGPSGTLAYVNAWYDTDTKLLVETDLVFDSSETWSITEICPSDAFDVQNIGTHEAGHTLLLNDLYDPADSEETMYGYASKGENKKRTLDAGDVAGICFIYPNVHDVAITGVTVELPYNASAAYPSWNINVNVTIRNKGDFNETFNVTAYYGENGNIGTQSVTDLSPAENITLIFPWDTKGVAPCEYNYGGEQYVPYTITANATPVPDETNTADNTFINGNVTVRRFGDANGDGHVDGFDFTMLNVCWLMVYPDERYNPNADFNGDGSIDGFDYTLINLKWLTY